MYGFDGNMTALDFADMFGFHCVNKKDQILLIAQGYYTVEGHRIIRTNEQTQHHGQEGRHE